MTYAAPNSVQARDIASIVHPQTNLVKHLEQGPMVMERGQGCYVYDDHGTCFLDAAAGLWCASLGYASERLARVAYEQMRKLGYYHLYRGTTNETGVDLAEWLLQIAPVPMSKVLFQCSGSEANDTAIKLVWYYHSAIGKPEKRKIIGRRMAYHGSTSASISASGTLRTPAAVLMSTGNTARMVTMNSLAESPRPNHKVTRGMIATKGVA